MRNPFLRVLHCAIVALSLCSASLLMAQISPPAKRMHAERRTSHVKLGHANPFRKSKSQRSLPVIAELPLNAPEQARIVPQIATEAAAPDSYHSPVNLKLLLPPAQARFVPAEEKRDTVAHLQAPQFIDAPSAHEPNPHVNDPEYYARHVPVVGGLVTHVLEQSKAHPRVTRVFQVIHPEF